MLSAFGFLKISCNLLVDCFVKPKRKFCQTGGSRTSDSDEEEYSRPPPPPTTTTRVNRKTKPFLKRGVKYIVRVLPPRPVEKPKLSLFAYFLNNKPRMQSSDYKIPPNLTQERVESITQQGLDQVRRRGVTSINKYQQEQDYQNWPNQNLEKLSPLPLGNLISGLDIESQCSLSSDDYPIDSISCHDSEYLSIGQELDTYSLFSPRNSLDTSSVASLGVNPTFFTSRNAGEDQEDDIEIEEFQSSKTRIPIRRINSIVESNETFKFKAQEIGQHNLLLNPAYGAFEREESDELEMQTKLKTLKSVVRNGCHATSNAALVGNKYIGHTSSNPIYGDLDSSDSSSVYSIQDDVPPNRSSELVYHEKKHWALPESERGVCDENPEPSKGSFLVQLVPPIPRVDLMRTSTGTMMSSSNMGMLTWRNVAYNQSSGSDDEVFEEEDCTRDEDTFVCSSLKKFTKSLPSQFESSILTSSNSSFADSVTQSMSDEVVKQGTEFRALKSIQKQGKDIHFQSCKAFPRSHSVRTFEEVDLDSKELTIESKAQKEDSESPDPCFSSTFKTSKQDCVIAVGTKGKKKSPLNRATKIIGTTLRHTRWAMRSLQLIISRFDPFSQPMDKLK
eukprot:g4628.t1